MDWPSVDDIDRRTYLRAVAAGAAIPGAVTVGSGAQEDSGDEGPADPLDELRPREYVSDWSTTVSNSTVHSARILGGVLPEWDPEAERSVDGDGDYNALESEESIYLYTPRTGELTVPDDEYDHLSLDERHDPTDFDTGDTFTVEDGVKNNGRTATILSLVTAMYLPFLGDGYWRYTFVVIGSAANYLHYDWDEYNPAVAPRWPPADEVDHADPNYPPTHVDLHIEDEEYARQFLGGPYSGADSRGRGYKSHAVLLYQPSSRPEGELSLVTSAREVAPYAVADPAPEGIEAGPIAEAAAAGFEAGLNSALSQVRNEVLVRGRFARSIARRTLAGFALNRLQDTIGVSWNAHHPDYADRWEEHYADLFTDDYDLALWKYDEPEADAVTHYRMFSVDVPPVETQRPDAPCSSPWSEFRISDQYYHRVREGERRSRLYRRDLDVTSSNELSVRVPKLPRPENADLFGYDFVPYCHVDDECIYTAPDVEPIVTVADAEVPWEAYHTWD